jgi:hypothetical protein
LVIIRSIDAKLKKFPHSVQSSLFRSICLHALGKEALPSFEQLNGMLAPINGRTRTKAHFNMHYFVRINCNLPCTIRTAFEKFRVKAGVYIKAMSSRADRLLFTPFSALCSCEVDVKCGLKLLVACTRGGGKPTLILLTY